LITLPPCFIDATPTPFHADVSPAFRDIDAVAARATILYIVRYATICHDAIYHIVFAFFHTPFFIAALAAIDYACCAFAAAYRFHAIYAMMLFR